MNMSVQYKIVTVQCSVTLSRVWVYTVYVYFWPNKPYSSQQYTIGSFIFFLLFSDDLKPIFVWKDRKFGPIQWNFIPEGGLELASP